MTELTLRHCALFSVLLLLSACGSPPPAADTGLPKLPDAALLNPNSTAPSDKMTSDAADLFQQADYDGLEKLAAQAESSPEVLAGGSTMPVFFYDGLTQMQTEDEDHYQQKMTALKTWIQARPDSPMPKVALAMVMTNYAWFARGNGYANTVTDQGWKDFGDRLQQARDYLNEAADKRQQCCAWYCAMATIALGQSWSHDDYFKMIEEEMAQKPSFVDLHGEVVIYLLPRWYGSDAELRDYITKAADRVGGDEGDMLYARIARRCWCYSNDVNVIDEVGLSWPRLKHGMELICNRYPESMMMANYFCLFACQAKDLPTAKLLFAHIRGRIDPQVWGNSLASSQAWADGN